MHYNRTLTAVLSWCRTECHGIERLVMSISRSHVVEVRNLFHVLLRYVRKCGEETPLLVLMLRNGIDEARSLPRPYPDVLMQWMHNMIVWWKVDLQVIYSGRQISEEHVWSWWRSHFSWMRACSRTWQTEEKLDHDLPPID